MEIVNIRKIKQQVERMGGSFEKCDFNIDGAAAYEVNGRVMSKTQLVESYKRGDYDGH